MGQLADSHSDAASAHGSRPASAARSTLTAAQEPHLCRLVFDARHLALSRITSRLPGLPFCEQCRQFVSGEDFETGHGALCRVGSVLRDLLLLTDAATEAASASTQPGPPQFGEPWTTAQGLEERLTTILWRYDLELCDLAFADCNTNEEEVLAARIVTCVNFCAGISTDQLEAWIAAERPGSRPRLRGEDALFGAAVEQPLEIGPAQVAAIAEQPDGYREVFRCSWPVCSCDEDGRCAETYPSAGLPSSADLDRVADEQAQAARTCEAPVDNAAGCGGVEDGGAA